MTNFRYEVIAAGHVIERHPYKKLAFACADDLVDHVENFKDVAVSIWDTQTHRWITNDHRLSREGA